MTSRTELRPLRRHARGESRHVRTTRRSRNPGPQNAARGTDAVRFPEPAARPYGPAAFPGRRRTSAALLCTMSPAVTISLIPYDLSSRGLQRVIEALPPSPRQVRIIAKIRRPREDKRHRHSGQNWGVFFDRCPAVVASTFVNAAESIPAAATTAVPAQADALVSQAREHLSAKRWNEAITAATKAIEDDPACWAAYVALVAVAAREPLCRPGDFGWYPVAGRYRCQNEHGYGTSSRQCISSRWGVWHRFRWRPVCHPARRSDQRRRSRRTCVRPRGSP